MSMTKQQFEEQQKAHLKKVAETRAKIEAKYPIVKAKPATTCAGALIVDSDAKKIYEYLAQPSVVYSIPIGPVRWKQVVGNQKLLPTKVDEFEAATFSLYPPQRKHPRASIHAVGDGRGIFVYSPIHVSMAKLWSVLNDYKKEFEIITCSSITTADPNEPAFAFLLTCAFGTKDDPTLQNKIKQKLNEPNNLKRLFPDKIAQIELDQKKDKDAPFNVEIDCDWSSFYEFDIVLGSAPLGVHD